MSDEHVECAICGSDVSPLCLVGYANAVCDECRTRAVNAGGSEPCHNTENDTGDNPVFIDGIKCWCRYKFGGVVAVMRDEHDCGSLREFYDKHVDSSRYRGALLGLAVGDALGTTLEFETPGTFPKHTDMTGGGPFHLKPGEWTDDTSMALCLAESLTECKGFDATDQMKRYCRWYHEGYLSSNGKCFDKGVTTENALLRFERTGDPWSRSTDPRSAGNGSLMRLAPIPIFYAGDPETAIKMSGESSRTTHGARTAVDACRYFGGLIVGAIRGEEKEKLLAPMYSPVEGSDGFDYWKIHPLAPEVAEVADGSFTRREPPQIQGSGYVVKTLEAALWALYKTTSFKDGAILAVNLGDDADTVGAVYGQIAGAYYGEFGIPRRWRISLAMRDRIEHLADQLVEGIESR